MTDNSKETRLPGRSSEGKSIANAHRKSTHVRYLHCLVLSAIIFASLLAASSGSHGIVRGDLAVEPVEDHVAAMGLTKIEGSIRPMEAMVASLAPLTPEFPPPVAAASVEIETPEDPASQPPPDPQPTPEPPPAVTPAATAVMETTPAPLDPSPVPQNDAGEGSATIPPEPSPVEPQPEPGSAPPPADAPAVRVTAIGDSVMLGAANTLALAIGDIEVDAEVSRQVSTAIDILRTGRDAGRLGEVVIVHIGNNGTFSASQFDQMMEVLAGVRRAVFVNLKVPRDWEGPNNAMLAENVGRYGNAVLVDWHGASAGHPEYFWDDGIHLRPDGAQAYTGLILAHVPVVAEPEPRTVDAAAPPPEDEVIAAICAQPWPCENMVRIATCESLLDPLAYNPAGLYGLFQLDFAFEGWTDPWVNAQVAYERKYLPALEQGDPLSPWPVCRWY